MRRGIVVKFSVMFIALLTTFVANTATTDWKYEKVVDREARMMYYKQCKLNEGENCHMFSFNKAVKLEIVEG
jgi:hypothetical protein